MNSHELHPFYNVCLSGRHTHNPTATFLLPLLYSPKGIAQMLDPFLDFFICEKEKCTPDFLFHYKLRMDIMARWELGCKINVQIQTYNHDMIRMAGGEA